VSDVVTAALSDDAMREVVLFVRSFKNESVTVFFFDFCVPFIVPAQSTSRRTRIPVAEDRQPSISNASDRIAAKVRIDLLMKWGGILQNRHG
jgi:hypothetical protein